MDRAAVGALIAGLHAIRVRVRPDRALADAHRNPGIGGGSNGHAAIVSGNPHALLLGAVFGTAVSHAPRIGGFGIRRHAPADTWRRAITGAA